MIRIRKNTTVPKSLTTTSSYDGEDVKEQLFADQDDKCYLCERTRETDFHIEHHKSQDNYPELIQNWNNLFMGCSYCNGKKLALFDDILYPVTTNIEEEIIHHLDFENKKGVFSSTIDDIAHNKTVELLSRIHNGTKRVRTFKEEKFIEHVIGVVNRFYELVKRYLENPSEDNEKAVRDELYIDKEMLGFKYWIVKDSPELYKTFATDIIWNKQ